jgi:hypothetical protein
MKAAVGQMALAGFCINCGVEPAMIEAVHAAYGAPVLELLNTVTAAQR